MSGAKISRHDSVFEDFKPLVGYAVSPIYHRLDQARKEIRLFVLEPGSGTTPIRGNFKTALLSQESKPTYDTASYAWGNAALRDSVSVDGFDLSVPRSAVQVLQRMRLAGNERTVWIDSVCIDQTDAEDRSYQVQLMSEIFSCTSANFVWLGEDDGDAEETFEMIQALYDEARRETDEFSTFKASVWPDWWQVYSPPTSVHLREELMVRLFNNPWFARLWVVQEAALAPYSTCQYGSSSLPLLHVLRAAVWLYSKSKSLPKSLNGHPGLARAVHTASYTDELFETPFRTKNNLSWMMHTLRQYSTSVDKDYVYGMIGMYQKFSPLRQHLPTALILNYNRTVREIYCDATKLTMVEVEHTCALMYVCHRSREEVNKNWLPTWIPQWNRKQDLRWEPSPLNHKDFRASGPSKFDINHPRQRRLDTLTLNGIVVDRIQAFASPFTQETLQTPETFLRLLHSTEALLAMRTCKPSGLEHTLVASLDSKRDLLTREQSAMGYRALVQHIEQSHSFPSIASAKGTFDINPSGAYLEALRRWFMNRCFFVTYDGYIGIGPKVMEQGDLVTILYGSRVPIVLREVDSVKSHTVVGQAYLDGAMFGEVVLRHDPARKGDVRFDLV